MRNLLRKEMRLAASPLPYLFVLFGLMFFLPGYPVLCGAYFAALGIFQGFRNAREANDVVFSALLPVAKRDVVKGKFLFVCLIEGCAFLLMAVPTALRMTVLSQAAVYRDNALLNANLFALGTACVIFGLFNRIFVCGFFRTAYKLGPPFVLFSVVCFLVIAAAEALPHAPGLERLNACVAEEPVLQTCLLAAGILIFLLTTVLSYLRARGRFESVDL